MTDSVSPNHLRFGPFKLTAEPLQLWQGTEQIALRPKSLGMLRYLAARPGQLINKEELLEQVWSGRVISQDGIRVCVREIRAALGDSAETPHYLETVAGKGYRFLEGRDGSALFPETPGPVVGRKSEQLELEGYQQRASDGERQFVLISGEPGIGKTTLLERALDPLAKQGSARIIHGQCMIRSGKGEAYGPLLEALARSCVGTDGSEIVAALQRYAPMWLLQLPGLADPDEVEQLQRRIVGATPERMTRELCDAIEGLASEKLVVLVVEDLHWSDVSTVDLLATLAQRAEPAQLLILGTYRPADAVLYAKHLRDTVRDLRARGQCEELLMELLSCEDVTKYLGGRLAGTVSDTLALEIFSRTNGNPLFMVNLIEGLMQQQLLVCQDGHWASNDDAQSMADAVPESLRLLISQRLETLSREERMALESASVVGIEFSVGDIAGVLGQPFEDVDALCQSLATRRQFINEAGVEERPDGTFSGRYQFQHPMYYDVLYEEVGEARRAELNRRISERIEKGHVGQAHNVTNIDPLEAWVRTDNQPGQVLPNSVAVLPFENLSPDPDNAFFAAGMHETTLNELAKVRDLHAMARTSVLRYADGQTPISQIAEDLNVQTVMEGTVQYADGRVRISVRLLDAVSGTPLWSEIYDREFTDIFAIQMDIAHRIASALRANLTPRDKEMLAEKPTQSFEAYAAYLRAIGVGVLEGGLDTTPEQSAAIHQSLDQALTLDPNFAIVYALKARDYAYSMARLVRCSDEQTVTARDELARENAEKALALDAKCGMAHAALAVAHRFAWRDKEARLAFNSALDLNPRDPRVLRDVAFFHLFRGNYDTAFEVAREIAEIEPLLGNYLIAWALMLLGKFEDAIDACQRVLSLQPDFSLAHQLHGFVMLSKGDKATAVEALRLSEELGYKSSVYAIAQTGFAYQILGYREDARRIFEQIEILAQEYIVTDAAWALEYLAVEDQDKALRSLSRAADQSSAGEDISAATIATNFFSAPVLEQPEFLELRRRLGFVHLDTRPQKVAM
jgi:TolB-like protein/DNA-binding winged helix-turn-helix (wHTH) protein/Flp pilus assembly protein TadD